MARTPTKINTKVTEIYVEILNWERFNPRKDVKHNSWFRCDHSLFEHPDFHDFTHSDIIVWLYLLCLASKKNSSCVTVYTNHADRLANISLIQLCTALQKLNKIKAITFKHVTCSQRGRNENVTFTCSTGRDVTLRNGTNETNDTVHVREHASVADELHPLASLWNEIADQKFPRVKFLSEKRRKKCKARFDENPRIEFWTEVITKINQSDFCKGLGDRGWVANFDFLIAPDTAAKALEGTYDNRKGFNTNKTLAIADHNDELISELMNERSGGR